MHGVMFNTAIDIEFYFLYLQYKYGMSKASSSPHYLVDEWRQMCTEHVDEIHHFEN